MAQSLYLCLQYHAVAQAARRQSLAPGAGTAPAGKRKAAAPPVPPGRAARPRLH